MRALTRRRLFDATLLFAPRSAKRGNPSVIKFEVGGSITRSIILALPNVHVDGINPRFVVGGIVIAVVLISVATSTTPQGGTSASQRFEYGDPFRLDVLVAPFHVVEKDNLECTQFAQKFSARLAEMVAIQTAQETIVWTPLQVYDTYRPEGEDGAYAQRYAAERKVDVVVHGTIACNDQVVNVRPQIYAADSFFAEAPEMVGFYHFDDLINQLNVKLDNAALEQAATRQAMRAATLISIGRGFGLYAGETRGDYLKAAELFNKIAETGDVTDRHGLAMLLYMAGKAHLAAVMDDCNEPDLEELKQASISFREALRQEPEFALAYAYLGNISHYEAAANVIGQTQSAYPDHTQFSKSMAYFQRAKSALVQPPNGLAKAIAAIGEAQIRISTHDINPAGNVARTLLSEAVDILVDVIKTYEPASVASKEMKSMLARAYGLLGDLQHAQFKDDLALSSYSVASVLAQEISLKTALALSMAELYTVRSDACMAAKHYQAASQTSCLKDKREFSLQAQQMQLFCQHINDTQFK